MRYLLIVIQGNRRILHVWNDPYSQRDIVRIATPFLQPFLILNGLHPFKDRVPKGKLILLLRFCLYLSFQSIKSLDHLPVKRYGIHHLQMMLGCWLLKQR